MNYIKLHSHEDLMFFFLPFSEMNQDLIASKGGGKLLANTASRANDPQTLRMVAGAISNLCGNGTIKEHIT